MDPRVKTKISQSKSKNCINDWLSITLNHGNLSNAPTADVVSTDSSLITTDAPKTDEKKRKW